ncbi:hypothetical protein HIM_01269 [Hirsutella minnesotensis 3608]|nr:hypothetical protein HIM_01269 [Hirsutella minnesotensis 3608]
MAAPSTFSYAQAAKGQGTPSSVVPLVNSSAQPQASQPTPSSDKNNTLAESTSELSIDVSQNADARPAVSEKQDVDFTNASESELRSETMIDKRIDSKRDDDAARLERPWRRAERGARSSSTAAQSVDDSDSRKSRKNKKSSRASDKQANDQASTTDSEHAPAPEAPKVELSEAPIPQVNIWQQRKEAQLAKVKPAANATEELTNGASSHVDDTKKAQGPAPSATSSASDGLAVNGTKPIRKVGEAPRLERNGSRGVRPLDREGKDTKSGIPPSVEDAMSWPTPESAIMEDRRKSSSVQVDRQDKEGKETATSDDGSQAKPRQKGKWVAYDYVPSVSFETQIPQMRNSKPRGGARPSNGTRTSAGAIVGDKPASTAPIVKSGETKERPREAGAASNRTASQPPAAKHSSLDASVVKDQKKTPGYVPGEKAKDTPSSHPTESGHGGRDRPEGRSERGRGGYRSRGGHHPIGSHSQHSHGAAGFASAAMPSRPQGPYSPPPRQGAHNQMFMPPQQRGGRGRNGAGANFHRMSLPNGSTRLPPVQTQFGPFEYPMPPLTAMPFQPHPYWDNVVMSLLKNQIEYYFSIENLCKDMYLRKRMDSQGYVNLHFVAAFKRIRELTSDMGMIRAVCESSTEVDFVVGEDDVERLRRRAGWQSFVLPMEDRDDFARNAGPSHVTFKNRPYNMGPQFAGMAPSAFGVSNPIGYSPQGEPQFQQFADAHAMNGVVNGGNVPHNGATQLSAEVPDFSPSGSAMPNGQIDAEQIGHLQTKAAANVGDDVSPKATSSTPTVNGCGTEYGVDASSSALDADGASAQGANQS